MVLSVRAEKQHLRINRQKRLKAGKRLEFDIERNMKALGYNYPADRAKYFSKLNNLAIIEANDSIQ